METDFKYRPLKIGLTGGIGTGKTEVGKLFESLGAKLLHADIIARNLVDSKREIKKKIIDVFGIDVYLPNGKLDRQRVAKLIFHNRTKQRILNQIVHPLVIDFIDREIKKITRGGKFLLIIVEAALIYEAEIKSSYDYIIVVDANEENRIDRLINRDNTPKSAVMNKIKAQMPQREKVAKADFVIHNNSDLKSLKEKCIFLFKLLSEMQSTIQTKGLS